MEVETITVFTCCLNLMQAFTHDNVPTTFSVGLKQHTRDNTIRETTSAPSFENDGPDAKFRIAQDPLHGNIISTGMMWVISIPNSAKK